MSEVSEKEWLGMDDLVSLNIFSRSYLYKLIYTDEDFPVVIDADTGNNNYKFPTRGIIEYTKKLKVKRKQILEAEAKRYHRACDAEEKLTRYLYG